LWQLCPSSDRADNPGRSPGPRADAYACEQFGRVDTKSGCQARDVEEGYVPLPSLYRSDVSPMKPRAFGQGFLRQTQLQAGLSDTIAECAEAVRHEGNITACSR
jgi:hypothetical protein